MFNSDTNFLKIADNSKKLLVEGMPALRTDLIKAELLRVVMDAYKDVDSMMFGTTKIFFNPDEIIVKDIISGYRCKFYIDIGYTDYSSEISSDMKYREYIEHSIIQDIDNILYYLYLLASNKENLIIIRYSEEHKTILEMGLFNYVNASYVSNLDKFLDKIETEYRLDFTNHIFISGTIYDNLIKDLNIPKIDRNNIILCSEYITIEYMLKIYLEHIYNEEASGTVSCADENKLFWGKFVKK